MVTGDFYAEPRPEVSLTAPDAASFAAKQCEQERLDAWLS